MSSIAEDLGWFPARLRDAGYTSEEVARLLGIRYPDDVGPLNHVAVCERLAGDCSVGATLARLFFLETIEPARRLAAALGRDGVETLRRRGLLRRCAGGWRARLRVDPVGPGYVLADRRFAGFDRGALRLGGDDPVYPPSADSLVLRDLLAVPAGGRVLDLCTGSGVQALRCAADAAAVVAVDVNPRAVAVARLNAVLAGYPLIDVREGDLYRPVRGEQFDLIVANPPFVPSPHRGGPSYHAGGPTGDRVLRRVLAGWDMHLVPGGRGFAISHVALRAGETMEGTARAWMRGFRGRAVVLVLESGGPVDLAAAQALFALEDGLPAYAAEVRRWTAYLRRHRIASIALVVVVAERGDRAACEVVEAQPRVLPIPLGPTPAERVAAWLGGAG